MRFIKTKEWQGRACAFRGAAPMKSTDWLRFVYPADRADDPYAGRKRAEHLPIRACQSQTCVCRRAPQWVRFAPQSGSCVPFQGSLPL